MIVDAGGAIRRLRELRGLSQSELARRAGTTQAHVSRVEHGLVSPTVRTLETLAAASNARIKVEAIPLHGNVDDDALREFRALTVDQRLRHAFSAIEFSSRLYGSAGR